jgi:hypothetical protein
MNQEADANAPNRMRWISLMEIGDAVGEGGI